MKTLLSLLLALAFAGAQPAFARSVHHHYPSHRVQGTNNLVTEGDSYTNVDGARVHRPVRSASKPAGATAQCRDGSYSFSRHHRGTCSHHGGVAAWQ